MNGTSFKYRPLLTDEGDELILEAAINGRAGIVTFDKHFDSPVVAQYSVRVYKPKDVAVVAQDRAAGGGTGELFSEPAD